MRRIKSRMELYTSLHLNQAEIERLFRLSESEARQVCALARKKDLKDLGEGKIIFPQQSPDIQRSVCHGCFDR